ncbi:hypothetical protein [Caproiciproducens sp.]
MMNEKNVNRKLNPAQESQDEYEIPEEAGCSMEFSGGCIFSE